MVDYKSVRMYCAECGVKLNMSSSEYEKENKDNIFCGECVEDVCYEKNKLL